MSAKVTIIKDTPSSRITKKNLYGKGYFLGICSGISDKFYINVTFLRIMWVLSCFFFFFGVIAYIAMAIILPEEEI